MRKNHIQRNIFLLSLLVFIVILTPKSRAFAASPVMEILVKDGYSKQVIHFFYGRTPSGYTGFYADTPSVLVHPKAKKVSFSVRNSDGTCSQVSFQYSSLTPSQTLKSNLMRFYAKGRTRAYMLSVKKQADPKVTHLKLTPSNKKGKFHPKGKRYLEIYGKFRSEAEAETSLRIENSEGKLVFLKNFKPSKGKAYTYRWNGRAFAQNELGLPKGTYVPEGVYKVTFSATVKMKKYEKTAARTKKIHIV